MKLHRDTILKTVFLVLLIVLFLASISTFSLPPPTVEDMPEWDFPRLDEIYMVEAYPADVAFEKAKASEIDIYSKESASIDPDDVVKLHEMGWNFSYNPAFDLGYIGINCRNVTPESSGVYYNYHNRTPGFELYPLNMSQFRFALNFIVGCRKDVWLTNLYGMSIRLDQCVPPSQEYWFNPYIEPYAEDWNKAYEILTTAGFNGTIEGDDWTMPNGVPLRNRAPIYVLCPGDSIALTSHKLSKNHVKRWNKFFTGLEVDTVAAGGIFEDDPQDTFTLLRLVPFYNRDHDLYFHCWDLGREPDYLYDFFHPDVDLEGGNNSPGLDHAGLNRVLWTIKFWKFKDWELLEANIGELEVIILPSTLYGPFGPFDEPVPKMVEVERFSQEFGVYDEELIEGIDYENVWEEGEDGWYVSIHLLVDVTLYLGDALELQFQEGTYHRPITDKGEMRRICWLIQWKLYYLCPYSPVYSGSYISCYSPGLTGWVESTGYGSATHQLPWTFASIHWEGTPVGGSINWHVPGNVSTLNPVTVASTKWIYEWTILNRLYDSLLVVNPYTHADMPWVAWRWETEPWVDLSIDVDNGIIIKFWLRNDVYWQDGDHVTAEDIAWNFDFIKSIKAPELYFVWKHYVKSEVVNDQLIAIYVNATGLWQLYKYAGSALIFPKTVWEPFWDNPEGAEAFKPWNITYQAWTGNPPPPDKPDLKCLIGTGSYWLDWWNPQIYLGQTHLIKNHEYWARKNLQKTAALAVPEPGLLWNLGKETGSVGYRLQFTNVNPDETLTFTWSCGVKDCFRTSYGGGIALDPYETVDIIYGPQEPQATGDLGGLVPPRWFAYDRVCNGKDLALLLMAFKNTWKPEEYHLWINDEKLTER